MALLTLQDAHLAFGLAPLLDGADLAIETRERIGLIGRNGSGKTSLLKVLAGAQPLDDGSRTVQSGVRVAMVPQEPVFAAQADVFAAVAEGLALPTTAMASDARPTGFSLGDAAHAATVAAMAARTAVLRPTIGDGPH